MRLLALRESQAYLTHGRCCLCLLVLLELLRIASWSQGSLPGVSLVRMHFLTTTSDGICVLSALPLFASGTRGMCVQLGCLGPLLSVAFSMFLVDMSVFGTYLAVAQPWVLPFGARSNIDVLESRL